MIPQNFEFKEPIRVNPLIQHFRQPKIFIDLPYGQYPEGVVIQCHQLPVFPMTQIDEITSKTPDALMNGSATVEIIKSCIPSIQNAWKLNSIDLDACLLAIKIASNGGTFETYQKCPKCDEMNSYEVNLNQILQQITAKPFKESKLVISDLEIEFQPLDYESVELAEKQQFEVTLKMQRLQENTEGVDQDTQLNQMKELNRITQLMLIEFVARSIKNIKNIKTSQLLNPSVSDTSEWLKNISKAEFKMIQDFAFDLKQKTQLQPLEFECFNETCKHKWHSPLMLNYSDFFA